MTSVINESFNEQELIKRTKAGDTEAFTLLVEKYSKRIYNIGLRMLGKNEDAADMTQEVLIKIYRYLGNFRGDSAFSTWVYRISVNSCCDLLRCSYRKKEIMFSDFGDDNESAPVFEVKDTAAGPEQIYLETEENTQLLDLVQTLNPKYRIVIVLREVAGLSYQEIADSVGISIGTVKSRLSRARLALAEKIYAEREQYPSLCCLINKDNSCKEAG